MVNPAPQTEESQHVTTPKVRQTQTGRADWSADTADPQMCHLHEASYCIVSDFVVVCYTALCQQLTDTSP